MASEIIEFDKNNSQKMSKDNLFTKIAYCVKQYACLFIRRVLSDNA